MEMRCAVARGVAHSVDGTMTTTPTYGGFREGGVAHGVDDTISTHRGSRGVAEWLLGAWPMVLVAIMPTCCVCRDVVHLALRNCSVSDVSALGSVRVLDLSSCYRLRDVSALGAV